VTSRPPLVVLLAGPNGAGKSTAAPDLLRGALAVEEFVNADTIAAGLSAYRPDSVAIAAGRVMLERLRHLAAERRDFAFETTLSGRGHARWLRELGAAGYRRHLIFLSLPEPDVAVARVSNRVRQGGHHVPETVVRRRFAAGLESLFDRYMSIVDSWQVYDNSELPAARLIALGAADGAIRVFDQGALSHLKEPRR
jgi:predicted ABC-type ATPase